MTQQPNSRVQHKPIIETVINTAAIAQTSFRVMQVTLGNLIGYLAIAVGVGLEVFKYWGRKKEYW